VDTTAEADPAAVAAGRERAQQIGRQHAARSRPKLAHDVRHIIDVDVDSVYVLRLP